MCWRMIPVLLAALITMGAGDDDFREWKKYHHDRHGTYFLDTASVEKTPGGITFWIKADPKEGDRYYRDIYKTDDIGDILFRYEVSCREKTQNSFGGTAVLYDRRGKIKMVYGSNLTSFKKVDPGTLEDLTRDYVCRNYRKLVDE